MTVPIARRKFVVALAGAAAWPLAARAQQGGRVRRIGALMSLDESDPEQERRLSAFTRALAGLGWTEGRNVRMELRWYGDDANRIRALAQELVGLQPDIVLTDSTPCELAVDDHRGAQVPLARFREGRVGRQAVDDIVKGRYDGRLSRSNH
jgi:putative ABC transport system substrate-binding protein